MNKNQLTALNLLASNGGHKDYAPRAHNIINMNVGALLAAGLVVYNSRKRCGYAITKAGKKAIAAN